MNFYNENDQYAVRWLGNLSEAGHIIRGRIDDRPIQLLEWFDIPEGQAHFFAGIGVWSRALRLAGWPDDVPVWTGSCPCQPFSSAGRRGGIKDERHLWPEWFRLIRECRPPVIFGEQVASPDGLGWLDAVSADLENEGYAVGAADIGAAGVGAPHIRQRLYFVAYAPKQGLERSIGESVQGTAVGRIGGGRVGELAYSVDERFYGFDASVHWTGTRRWDATCGFEVAGSGVVDELGHSDDARPQGWGVRQDRARQRVAGAAGLGGFWRDADWIFCRDEKWRAVEPGTFPLAHGPASGVGRLRAYGNALCAETAAAFVRAVMDALDLVRLLE